jgi:hypothetical protein
MIILSNNPLRYLAYLVRLWADDQSPPVWRFSVENTQTQARRGFGTLEELMAFLQNSMEALDQSDESESDNDES